MTERIVRHVWNCTRRAADNDNRRVEMVLSSLLHVVGIHQWEAGKTLRQIIENHFGAKSNEYGRHSVHVSDLPNESQVKPNKKLLLNACV